MDKHTRLCGLCFKEYANLQQHFKVSHTIANDQERLLLLKYGSASLDKPIDCDKKQLTRLDKHLVDVHKLYKAKDRQDLIIQVKRAYYVEQLALLRQTGPDPPMTLDISGFSHSETGGCGLEEAIAVEQEEGPEPDCAEGNEEADGPPASTPPNPGPTTAALASPGSDIFPIPTSTPNETNVPLDSPELSTVPDAPSPPKEISKSSGISSASSTVSRAGRCQGCELLKNEVAELKKTVGLVLGRVDLVERKVRHLYTPQKRPFPKTGSVQKGEKFLEDLSGSLYGKILLDFTEYRIGGRTGYRVRDNAHLAQSHVHRFLKYMIAGCKGTDCRKDMGFMQNIPRLRFRDVSAMVQHVKRWPTYLAERGYKVSSIKNMLLNTVHFFRHLENCFLAESGLSLQDVHKILYEIKGVQRDVGTKLVAHRQQVLRAKTEKQISRREQMDFLKLAKKTIPDLLDKLYVKPKNEDLSQKVIGYLMCYLAILTGHRAVVFCNLRKEHVKKAEEWDNGQKFRVYVDDHKTVRSFGEATLSLFKREYDWLVLLLIINERRAGCASPYVFHHTDGRRVEKPNRILANAWAHAGFKLEVSFGLIRSSVTTQANRHLTVGQCKDLAKAMCHDLATADRFYVALPNKEEAHEMRKLRMNALFLEAMKGGDARPSAASGKTAGKGKGKGKRGRSPTPSSSSSSEEEFVADDGSEDGSEDSSSSSDDGVPTRKRRLIKDTPHVLSGKPDPRAPSPRRKVARVLRFGSLPPKVQGCAVVLQRLDFLEARPPTLEAQPPTLEAQPLTPESQLILFPRTQDLTTPSREEMVEFADMVQETQNVEILQGILKGLDGDLGIDLVMPEHPDSP